MYGGTRLLTNLKLRSDARKESPTEQHRLLSKERGSGASKANVIGDICCAFAATKTLALDQDTFVVGEPPASGYFRLSMEMFSSFVQTQCMSLLLSSLLKLT